MSPGVLSKTPSASAHPLLTTPLHTPAFTNAAEYNLSGEGPNDQVFLKNSASLVIIMCIADGEPLQASFFKSEGTPGMNKLFLCSPQLLAINLGILVEGLVKLYNSRKHFSYELVIQ